MMRLKILAIFITSSLYLYSENIQNGGIIDISNKSSERYYPIGFNSKKNINKEMENKLKYKPMISFEIGLASFNESYLEITDKLEFPTINRNIEFYSKSIFSPILKVNFRDISLARNDRVLFRNSIQTTYKTFSFQDPFLDTTGQFPYGNQLSVGSEIKALAFSWIGEILYRISILSFGGYIGGGINILNGEAFYLKYSSDLNNSLANNIGIFNGALVERGDTITLLNTTSILGKYGLVFHLDISPFRFSAGIDYGITNEANLYFIDRSYFVEATYVF